MAQRGIREYDAKKLIAKHIERFFGEKYKYHGKVALVTPNKNLDEIAVETPWVRTEKLVVKPDQLFGKRGKHGLLLVNTTFDEAKNWIAERMNKEVQVGKAKGELNHFLIEPFIEHDKEYYLAFTGHLEGDYIHFSIEGGVDIEANWEKVKTLNIPIEAEVEDINFLPLLIGLKEIERASLLEIIPSIFKFYRELHFGFLEYNPFTFKEGEFFPLDAVARLDDTAHFVCAEEWSNIEFPSPFGRTLSKEERYIKNLDEKSGSSLKLTILNLKGCVWTIVAGGGASVIYADTVVDLGFGQELSNYGEYSGNPTTDETKEYAKTIFDMMTREKIEGGKVLIIGGGIANFTDVAKTFEGIIMALEEYADRIKEFNISIYVRRGGPNYEAGLVKIKEAGDRLGLQMEVHGPEAHMTSIVRTAVNNLSGGE